MAAVQRVRLALAEAPGTLPALVAVSVIVYFVSDQGGQPALVWYPGGLILLGALAVSALALPPRLADRPLAVKVAAAGLFAYAVWCALSIVWAHDHAAAWDGANRTFLYLMIFALLASWRQRTVTAATVLGAWALAIGLLALIALVNLNGANAIGHVIDARLADPAGYPNATAATFLMAFWPALALASRAELHPWLRALFAGAATLMAEAALVTQSRGAVYSLPLVAIAYFVLVPSRVRGLLTLLPITAAVAATGPHTIHAIDTLQHVYTSAQLATVPGPLLVAACVVALVVLVAAAGERRRPLSTELAARGRRAVGVVAAVLVLVGLLGGLVAVGDPVARARSAWHSFRHAAEPVVQNTGRLGSGLGSQRYDFYRVGIDQFIDHPLLGVGVDNFGQEYLTARQSDETPHYPHSIELRLFSQTGVVGAILALGAVISALVAAAGGIRRRVWVDGVGWDALAPVVAAGATVGFASWAAHGSFDWFWEFPALGGAAWMLLGLAGALAPGRGRRPSELLPTAEEQRAVELGGLAPIARSEVAPVLPAAAVPAHAGSGLDAAGARAERSGPLSGSLWPRGAVALQIGVLAGCAVLAISFVLPYLAAHEVDVAQRVAPANPGAALSDLSRAAALNPLADQAQLTAVSIDVQLGFPSQALTLLTDAIARNGDDGYAWLIRGALESSQGDRLGSLVSLQRALTLNPRDPIGRQALSDALAGRRVDPIAVYRQVAANSAALLR